MAALHQTTVVTPLSLGIEEDVTTLNGLLMTPFKQVYKLSPDSKTYMEPHLLLGTPVQLINGSHEYYKSSWDLLDILLVEKGPNAEKKREARACLRLDPRMKH